MNKVTIFSAPKPFMDPHINIIQRNAVRSWKALGPQVDVLLIGDEPGMKEAAEELEVKQIQEVLRNPEGTPLVSSIFELARGASTADVLIYLNADILLLPEILSVIDAIKQKVDEFLLVGRRWDVDLTREIDFDGDWVGALKNLASQKSELCSHTAMDYFIFPHHLLQEVPPFAIGRAGWDNWMIYNGVHQPWPVIDITPSNQILHQNHDYHHLPDGQAHYNLEESHRNVELAGGLRTVYDLRDVALTYKDGLIQRKKVTRISLLRGLERWITPEEQKGRRWQLTLILRKWISKISEH